MSHDKKSPSVKSNILPIGRTLLQTASAVLCFLSLAACDKAPESPPESSSVLNNTEAPQVIALVAQESPLAKAAARGNLAKAKELLDEGASINASDALGRTPLHMAAFSGHPKTSDLLIARGANIEAKDRVGMTPLHAAVLGGDEPEVELILDKNPNIKAATDTGLSALHLAAATGQDQIAATLIRRGADPQSKDRDGRTPLFYALKNEHPSTVTLLRKY